MQGDEQFHAEAQKGIHIVDVGNDPLSGTHYHPLYANNSVNLVHPTCRLLLPIAPLAVRTDLPPLGVGNKSMGVLENSPPSIRGTLSFVVSRVGGSSPRGLCGCRATSATRLRGTPSSSRGWQ